MALESIHKADAKSPEFGVEHDKYVKNIRDEERKKLIQKYNLNDSIFTEVSVYGMSYCK